MRTFLFCLPMLALAFSSIDASADVVVCGGDGTLCRPFLGHGHTQYKVWLARVLLKDSPSVRAGLPQHLLPLINKAERREQRQKRQAERNSLPDDHLHFDTAAVFGIQSTVSLMKELPQDHSEHYVLRQKDGSVRLAYFTEYQAVRKVGKQVAGANETPREQQIKLYNQAPLADTRRVLGKGLMRSLKELGPGQHVIEIGPGVQCGLARNYFTELGYELSGLKLEGAPVSGKKQQQKRSFFRQGRAKWTAIGMEGETLNHYLLSEYTKRKGYSYNYHGDRKLEDYSAQELEQIGKADLVIDKKAALEFTRDLKQTTNVILGLLNRKGKLLTHLSPFTSIIDAGGNDRTLDWLSSIKGAKVARYHCVPHKDGVLRQIELVRTSGRIEIPDLAAGPFVPGDPPTRVFYVGNLPRQATTGVR